MQISNCRQGTLQKKLRIGVWKLTLLLDVIAPEADQKDCSYVQELSRHTFDPLCKNLAWWNLKKPQNWKKKWVWALSTVGHLPRAIQCNCACTQCTCFFNKYFMASKQQKGQYKVYSCAVTVLAESSKILDSAPVHWTVIIGWPSMCIVDQTS